MGADAVVLLRDPRRARELVLRTLDVAGDVVNLPANSTDDVLEAVRAAGGVPQFGVRETGPDGMGLTWRQLPLGLWWRMPHGRQVIDGLDTLADPAARLAAEITLLGLHLSARREQSGALVALRGPRALEFADRLQRNLTPGDEVDTIASLQQLARLLGPDGLADRQRRVVDEVWRGLHEAGGLPLLSTHRWGGLPLGVAIRIPDDVDAATFLAYVSRERTPIHWLAWLQPVHYAAFRVAPDEVAREAAELARWLVVPAEPDAAPETIAQSVLGVVKAAEYLGVRWWIDPARAAAYAALLSEWYGPDHDGFRVASYARCGPCLTDPAMAATVAGAMDARR